MTPLSPEILFEKMMIRSGLQPCGGNITRRPEVEPERADASGSQAWANRFAGLFVIDKMHSGFLDADMTVLRDVIACGVVLNDTSTQLVVGKQTFEAESSIMTTIYLPRGKRFHYSTCSPAGLRSVTIVLDMTSFTNAHGVEMSQLPLSFRRMSGQREPIMEQVKPSNVVMRVINDIISKRGMFSMLPSLYLKAKTLELMSAWLWQLDRQDVEPPEEPMIDPRTRERLAIAKQIIDQKPALALNINFLAKEAAMNRTKLRSAFKAVYGTTLVDYRTGLLMQRAEQYLRKPGMTVQEAAFLAGYANASSFIVAYKRYFGHSPGNLKRH